MNIKLVLSFIGTFGAGALAGKLISDKLEKNNPSDTDVQTFVDEINELNKEISFLKNQTPEKRSVRTPLVEEKKSEESTIAQKTKKAPKGDTRTLAEMAKKYHDPDLNAHIGERDHPSEEAGAELDLNGCLPLPLEITWETYGALTDPPAGYEEIAYYPMDDILLDPNNQVLEEEDMIGYLGEKLRAEIRDREDDNIYVLNHPLDCFYIITLQHGASYYSMDDGIDYVDKIEEPEDDEDDEDDEEDEEETEYFDPRHPGKSRFR